MEKSDLKTGMLVETKKEGVYMVINGYLIKSNGFIPIDEYYSSDLKVSDDDDFTIKKVSKQLTDDWLVPRNWSKENLDSNILWDRSKSEQDKEKAIKKRAKQIRKAAKILGKVVKDLKLDDDLARIVVYDNSEIDLKVHGQSSPLTRGIFTSSSSIEIAKKCMQ